MPLRLIKNIKQVNKDKNYRTIRIKKTTIKIKEQNGTIKEYVKKTKIKRVEEKETTRIRKKKEDGSKYTCSRNAAERERERARKEDKESGLKTVE